MALILGRNLGITESEIEALRFWGILHDIGKITVPEYILNKPGALSSEETEVMKSHPVAGYNICLDLKKYLGRSLDVISQHHEKLDGSGYPDGLKNEDIFIASRIMSVVDIYDALVTDRAYREGLPLDRAIEIFRQEVNKKNWMS